MTLSNSMTRDDARAAFARNLTYAQVQANDVRALEGYLCIEYARHSREGSDIELHAPRVKRHEPKVVVASTGGIREAYLRVSGRYFDGREAVSFNADGFIGIAGWADDGNVQPFVRGLMRWIKEWMGCTRGVPRSAVADPVAYAAALAC